MRCDFVARQCQTSHGSTHHISFQQFSSGHVWVPDLAHSDNFLFANLHQWLGGQWFLSDAEVKAVVHKYFQKLDKNYYALDISKLFKLCCSPRWLCRDAVVNLKILLKSILPYRIIFFFWTSVFFWALLFDQHLYFWYLPVSSDEFSQTVIKLSSIFKLILILVLIISWFLL